MNAKKAECRFKVGDLVRDYRFNVDFFGVVIHVDTVKDILVVRKKGGICNGRNYVVPMHMMDNLSGNI